MRGLQAIANCCRKKKKKLKKVSQKYRKVQQINQQVRNWLKYKKNMKERVKRTITQEIEIKWRNKSLKWVTRQKKEVNWVHLHTKKVCASTSGTDANISETRCQNEHTWCWTTEHWTIEYWTLEHWTIELVLALHSDNKKGKKEEERRTNHSQVLDVPNQTDQILTNNKVYDPPCDQNGN